MSFVEFRQAAAQSAQAWGRDLTVWLHQHHKRVLAGVGGSLLLTSAAAFALAYEGPQAHPPAPTWVSVAVASTAPQQADQLSVADEVVYTTAHVRANDTVESLLRRLQVTDPQQLRQLSASAEMRALVSGDPGRVVSAQVSNLGEMQSLQGRLPGLKPVEGGPADARQWRELSVKATPSGWDVQTQSRTVKAALRVASGTVKTTFFAAADEAGMPHNVASQLIDVFDTQINFRRNLRPGDRFNVVYRVYQAQGQTLTDGRLVSAEFVNQGHDYKAVWFDAKGDTKASGYYAPNGDSLSRAFLLSPLPYDRITSGWGWRENPVMHFHEFHKGIDLAIPVGTPVKTIADGRVVYAGWGTGYGKYVKVEHPGGFATIYSHLSAFKVHVGEQVKQGEVVALSGNTGWSTGPHLYFQFFVHGTPVNPLTIAQYAPKGTPVPAALRAEFLAQTKEPRQLLALIDGGADAVMQADAATGKEARHG
ncbi:M23 family metallopeptidase [Thiomonas bhubaneswarensis]|uniref:Murein DD-endopeptidase MepM and murein hydrolase activator NlpD, contain LysM domain n=1 Tax=Thiomonas bhubaneswarensis TaxID=339866 RepID=A0A0K6HSG6_9BURK|nr:M23 family metallopeptidase [Thiomonas bhubaneswarensis]CUA93982.1 Murein DD-endopeptidase MepM and murein hydrolase activator NlpD, contain LysM domain [Thiomonas bhubaneswarensis]